MSDWLEYDYIVGLHVGWPMKREGALGKELPQVYKRCPPELSQKKGVDVQ